MPKFALGKGLRALIPEGPEELDRSGGQEIVEIDIDSISPSPRQPRREFEEEGLTELAESIKRNGVVQPLLVRRVGEGFELVAGERRWRAARLAGLKRVPVMVRDLDDRGVVQVSLVENLQREDLNPMEEAGAYRQLIEDFGMTQDQVAEVLGKSRPAIANTLRLLNLPTEIQEYVSRGTLSMGHARALLSLPDQELQLRACGDIIKRGLSVRQTEELVRRVLKSLEEGNYASPSEGTSLDPELERIQEELQHVLGTRVYIRPGKKKGKIEIEYYSDDDLQRILEVLL